MEAGSRLEWLPLEAIAYPGCRARNEWQATLGAGAELLAWDVTALGLPNADQPFVRGLYEQHLSIPNLWLEQAQIDAADVRLLDSPLGLGGLRCMGTMLLASGSEIARGRRESLLGTVREVIEVAPNAVRVAATCPNERMLVVRAMAPQVEPLMDCFQSIWRALRPAAWGVAAQSPRIWRV
jgi:urease accessory protein